MADETGEEKKKEERREEKKREEERRKEREREKEKALVQRVSSTSRICKANRLVPYARVA